MSPISRRSLIAVLLVTAVLTAVIALPLQAAATFVSPVPPPPAPPPPPTSCSGVFYRVHLGDTLGSIAARFGVSVSTIASCNGIANVNRIFAGMLLVIPGGHFVPPPAPGGGCGRYVVRFGDTLNSIARRFGVSVWTLASVNGIRNINFIFAGQVLRIPCGATPPPTAAGWYRVRAGDTVSSIAARFGESVFEIINANGLHFPYTIFVGQWLRIP